MPTSALRFIATASVLGCLLAGSAGPAASQTISLKTGGDSIAWIGPRLRSERAGATLYTRDQNVVLHLTDTTLVLQFTDAGINTIREAIETDTTKGVGERILLKMFSAGIAEMFDHGFAYRLSALRSARAEGNRLILEDRQGDRVFDNVEMSGRQVMDDFPAADAERFAAALNAAIRRQRAPLDPR